jgi:DNA-directed RNA polymerase subunit RPC12/RpoP
LERIMHKFLGDTPVSITCHACGKQLQKKIKWIKKNKTLKCKKCGKKIDLTKPEVKKAVKEVSQAIANFETSLGKLYKTATRSIAKKSSAKRTTKPVRIEVSPIQPTNK